MFKNLSPKDKTLFTQSFEEFDFNTCASFLLSELILEMNWFVNSDLIQSLDSEFQGKSWGILPVTYDNLNNNIAFILANEANSIFEKE